jgi:branched-chain amino acid transport system substrate-binding protein
MKRTIRRGLVGAATAVTAASLVLSGCGSSDDDASGDKAGDSAAAAPTGADAPKGSPIKVGNIASLSGSQASSSNQSATVGPAWADWVNANGGINGHPVEVISEDDGGDPAKAQAAAKKLVEDDKVVAILVGSDNLLSAFSSYVTDNNVALVSGTANNGDWYKEPGRFVTVTDTVSGLQNQLLVAQKYGEATKFADLYCAEVSSCAEAIKLQSPVASKIGLDYTSLGVSSTATSYTAQCLQLKQEGVDYAQLNFTTAAAVKFIQDCQAQGYNPTWGTSEQALSPSFLDLPDITMYGPAYAFPSVLDAPSVQTFRDAMETYAKDDNWKEGTASFAWSGLEALHEALSGIGADAKPTAKSVMTALTTKIKNTNLDGLLANKVTFTADKPLPMGGQPCSFVVGIEDGEIVAPGGTETVCASAS